MYILVLALQIKKFKKYMGKCVPRFGYTKVLIWVPIVRPNGQKDFELVWKWVKSCDGCCCDIVKRPK